MRIKRFVLCILITIAATAAAQDRHWEITPFGGHQWGGDFTDVDGDVNMEFDETSTYGLMVDIDWDWNTQLEFYFSRQETELRIDEGGYPSTALFDVDVNYLHFGGTYFWDYGSVKPYIVATMGLTYLDPDVSGGDSETDLSFGIGGGVKFMATDWIGLRLDGRALGTFVDSRGSVFCGNGCTVYFESDMFWQYQVTAGLVLRF
jgi:opacity protein-like surface antigen